MLHIDGSKHAWLALVPDQKQTLITVIDDATSRVLYSQLWREESTEAVLVALREVVDETAFRPASTGIGRAGRSRHRRRGGRIEDSPDAGGRSAQAAWGGTHPFVLAPRLVGVVSA